MKKSLTWLLHFLMPERCLLCDKLNAGLVCITCCKHLKTTHARCTTCGIFTPSSTTCGHCLKEPPYFDKLYCCFDYAPPLSLWISAFKFAQKLYFARFFADQLYTHLKSHQIDLIIAMPLHKKRLRQRGYNQAHEIAKRLAKKLTIKHDIHLVEQIKHTVPQTQLDYQHRKKNIRGVFRVRKPAEAKRIAIIDDVVTTGSSVNEIARLLKNQGVEWVEVWCIARTQM